MATRAISADVKAANSKLAQFLRRQEEEENILTIGKKKPKKVQEERLAGGRARWQLEPDWTAPTPMVDRPRTVAGATSFHFSYISVSKQGVPTVDGQPVEGGFGAARNAALEHSKYIERDGAAEVSHGAEHAAYVERPEAVERLGPAGLIAEAHERQLAAIFNETPTEEEAQLLGIEAIAPKGIPSVFSNISDDPFERQEFWRAVERIERSPKTHELILEPDVAAAWWRELETTTKLDPRFKEHALQVAEAYRQYRAGEFAGETRPPFEAMPFSVTSEQAGKIIQSAQKMANYSDYAPPFEFKSGRGGRVQFRMVAELPHELAAEDRALIVQNFCDHLGSLQERRNLDGTLYKTGMMYTAVIHAPDSHNDSRNYHLHVVAYDRPAGFMDEHGMWDFEVEERYNHKGEDRIRYPHRRPKIEELTRIPKGKEGEAAKGIGINFVPTLRAKFAEINNAVLKARGVRRKLDPRKYSDMGIDRTPTEHLGTKAAALEAIGVPTAVGQLNALAIWSDAERAIKRQAIQAGKAYANTQADLDKVARAITAVDPNAKHAREYRAMLAERERLIADVAEDREGIMTFDHLEAKAKSRAIRTRQTCLQFLADIENGKAERNTKMMRLAIQDRWKGAQQHIEAIDKALAPHRAALADAARDVERREARIVEIDTAIQPIRAVLEARVAATGQSVPAGVAAPSGATQHSSASISTIIPPGAEKSAISEVSNAGMVRAAEPAPFDPVEEAVAVEPATIGGLPIIEPTIAPRVGANIDQYRLNHVAPENLVPLRTIEAQAFIDETPEVVVADIDQPIAAADVAAPDQDMGEQTAETPATVRFNVDGHRNAPVTDEPSAVTAIVADEPDESKIKRGREVTDPALSDPSDEQSIIQSEKSKAAYADFDALVVRIEDDRVPIRGDRQLNGTTKFFVPSLNAEEQGVLFNPRFVHRANQRLEAIHSKQQNEIQRVVRWVQTQGQLPDMLRLENRKASLGPAVKQSVRTLFKHWGRHDAVISAIRNESARRIQLAAEVAALPVVEPERVDRDLEARKAEAANLYPTPDKAYTQEVEDFIKLLLDAASADQLREAADKIHESARAREDINKHNVHLATAYRRFVGERGPAITQRRQAGLGD